MTLDTATFDRRSDNMNLVFRLATEKDPTSEAETSQKDPVYCAQDSEDVGSSSQPPSRVTTWSPVVVSRNEIDHIDLISPNRRMRNELHRLVDEQAQTTGWRVGLSEIHLFARDITCFFCGPLNTPYEKGVFYVRIHLDDSHPFRAPRCQMLTKIHHPNFDDQGRICLDLLQSGWSPVMTLTTLLISIAARLDPAEVDEPLVPSIADQYVKDRALFDATAEMYTQRLAMQGIPERPYYDAVGHPWWEAVSTADDPASMSYLQGSISTSAVP